MEKKKIDFAIKIDKMVYTDPRNKKKLPIPIKLKEL